MNNEFNKNNNSNEPILIPKYERYMEYMLEVMVKLPKTEKFNIGNEFKSVMYRVLENILYVDKIEKEKRLYYLNLIDAGINAQRIYLRIMVKNKWIDKKKFDIAMRLIYEIGKILGGLIKFYAKNIKK